jgi:hypothetical protein
VQHSHPVAGCKPRTSSQPTHDAVHRASTTAASSPRRRWLSATLAPAVAALFTAATMAAGAHAWANPGAEVPPPPPATAFVPSSPPATAKSADGWTLALSANGETRTPAPPLDPAVPSRDFIVGGLFNGTLRGPNGAKSPTQSGILEVGYQIQCVPAGMLAALKPAVVDVPVLKEEFTGANPSAAVTAFRVQVDCMGPAAIRSYAILTRTTNAADAVVAYYGISTPAVSPPA